MNELEALRELLDIAPDLPRDPKHVHAELIEFIDILQKWQRVQNLVSRETGDAFWRRHVLDSLQLLPIMSAYVRTCAVSEAENEQNFALRGVDLGSGGGFPSLPLAIALKGTGFDYHLYEANGRKCAFLNAVKRALMLPITVHNQRIEAEGDRNPADFITSRALAPLPLLLGLVYRFWGPRSRALLHKGREFGEELREADSLWRFDVVSHRSRVDPDGVILEFTALEPKRPV